MNKFGTLLKKEIKELLTLQLVLPLLIGMIFFVLVGNIIGDEGKKAQGQQTIALIDNDGTKTSGSVTGILEKNGFYVDLLKDNDVNKAVETAKAEGIQVILSIPSGFEAGMQNVVPQEIGIYSIVRNLSIFSSSGSSIGENAVSDINEALGTGLIKEKTGLSDSNVSELKDPVSSKDFIVVGNNIANLNPNALLSFVMSQTTFLPIVIFIVIIFASQMIVVAIASEKENKTLETLLSSPISRVSIVVAKMTAAGLVSLFMALVYMGGFKNYMDGITGAASTGIAQNPNITEVLTKLGLNITAWGYVLLGISLFLSILDALSISLILGVFAEDVKKAQGLIAPLIFLVMIPYLITMFIDLKTASPVLRYLIYAIPFTHTFTATSNLFLHNYSLVAYGIIYQALVLGILIFICTRIFSTDKVLTMKLSMRRRTHAKNA